jgi:hypothetical protein
MDERLRFVARLVSPGKPAMGIGQIWPEIRPSQAPRILSGSTGSALIDEPSTPLFARMRALINDPG